MTKKDYCFAVKLAFMAICAMELDEYIKFANDNPTSYFATVESDQPRVRGLLLWFADKSGLYYSISGMKDVYKQLKVNPKVEVCFLNPKSKNLEMMRESVRSNS